jgi:hypothetical protein
LGEFHSVVVYFIVIPVTSNNSVFIALDKNNFDGFKIKILRYSHSVAAEITTVSAGAIPQWCSNIYGNRPIIVT